MKENALARQAMKEFGVSRMIRNMHGRLPDEIMPRLLKYASWILKQKEEGSSAAATLFKGIQESENAFRRPLGKNT